MRRLALQLAAAAALGACAGLAADGMALPRDRPYDVDVVPTAGAARWLALGHTTLVANLYYLRAVQYVGDPQANGRGWEKLHPLLDLVTDLDPAHGYAYQVGGVLLGSVHRVGESNALLEKGMRNVPERYILPFLRAFNAFYYEGDYAAAGRWFERAANVPGAPEHLRQSALAMYVKGGRPEAAIAFLESVRAQAGDPETRRAIDESIRQAELERAAARLDAAAEAYRARYGLFPFTPWQLVGEGLLADVPPDPYAGTWSFDRDGRARSSAHAFRFARPEHPGAHAQREPGVNPSAYGPGAPR